MRSRHARAGALRVLAEHLDLAAVAVAVALEDLDRRRLAGAVRAEQAEHLAGADLEVDAADAPRGRRSSCGGPRPDGAHELELDAQRRRAGSGLASPVSASTISLQSGWWPTTTTASPRPATAARRSSTSRRAPGARRPRRERRRLGDRARRLARAQQRARDDGVGLLGSASRVAERPRRGASRGGQRAQRVRFSGRGLGVANEEEAHRPKCRRAATSPRSESPSRRPRVRGAGAGRARRRRPRTRAAARPPGRPCP